MGKRMPNLDIHNYEQRWQYAARAVRNSTISERNKTLIVGYRDACLVKNVCGRVRLIRIMGALTVMAQHLGKDFDQATKNDLERLIAALLARQPPYTAQTLGTYKTMLKNFMTWVLDPDHFPTKTPPAQVSWISGHVRRRDKHRLERNDLLTPEEIKATLGVIQNTRDKALVSILWETGARIAEIGNLQLKHVSKREHGYTLDVNGKTGQRSPLVVSSAPNLALWLANHPFRNDPEAPLWVHYQFSNTPRQMQYGTIRYLLQRYLRQAGVTKRVYPHLFRHSRATYVLASGIMTEQAAKVYFGWVPNTDQLATYSHLVDQDANDAILRENNLTREQKAQQLLAPRACSICGELNQPDTVYCTKCSAVLDLKKAFEHQQVHDLHEDVTMTLFQILVEKGLLDEAAKAVHEAGLGGALKRLAAHADKHESDAPAPAPGGPPPDDAAQPQTLP